MGAVKTIEHESNVPTVITPAAMLQQAIEKGSGVEVMERLLALQERHDAFQARKAFDNAMADLRNNLPKIIKSREVDFTSAKGRTNYKFEDLAEITEALAGPMSDVGLSFRWYTENVQAGVKVTCRITHRDGHFEETSLVGPLDASGNKNPIQAIGSAVSYLQRYTLKAAVGIAASHDDDAQAVGQRKEPPRPATASKQASRATYDRLSKANRACETIEAFNKLWGHPATEKAVAELPRDWFDTILDEKADKFSELSPPQLENASANVDDFPFDDDFPGDR
ncbi:ERF family protein [Pelagibacterium lentulum]|uniref:ERF superfamily protein n=1 Tax=Pelagibacterium lentulum TaxID=2029865 RepID=A0A916VWU5_9HYPH|nr:ERF family protein [Pelagibacterium lentulum]GGA45904.1 hypothetical protein GCM10011499_14560 [Pelagibacterium lentulum]